MRDDYTDALRLYRDSIRELDEIVPSPDFPEAYEHALSVRHAFEHARDVYHRHLWEHRR